MTSRIATALTGAAHHRLSRRQALRVGGLGLASAALAGSGLGRVAARQSPTVTADRVTEAIAQLESLIDESMGTSGVPGLAIAIVHDDAVVYSKGFGLRSVDASDRVTAETVFQLASVSKSLAATTVAAVVSGGAVTWDSKLVDLLPDFQLSDPWVTREVSIRDCFSHRTGMPGTAGDDLEGIGFDRETILHQMRYLNLTGEFRQTYSYSNFGLTAGAVAAAAAAGETWEEIAAARLYTPFGMTSTSSRHADFAARENRAELHTLVEGQWIQGFTRQPDAQSPAGGVSSNVIDLAQWLRLLLGNGTVVGVEQKVGADALAEIFVPQIVRGASPVTGGTSYYGLGWGIDYDEQGRIFWGHAGAFSVGARTVVQLLPEENLGVVVLTNAFPTGLPETVAASFYDLVLNGALTRDWSRLWDGLYEGLVQSFGAAAAVYATPPANPDPPLAAVAYAGQYTNDYFGALTVEATGETLTLSLGPQPVSYPLRHWERDLFIYEPAPELPGVMSAAVFTIDPDGQAMDVTVKNLDGYGQGTFTRE